MCRRKTRASAWRHHQSVGASRSDASRTSGHAVFTLTVRRRVVDGSMQECHLALVDLGAAEIAPPGSEAGARRTRLGSPRASAREARPANVSLSALHKCIGALGDACVDALGANAAVLLANHGSVAVGPDLDAALYNARRLEQLASSKIGVDRAVGNEAYG